MRVHACRVVVVARGERILNLVHGSRDAETLDLVVLLDLSIKATSHRSCAA
jgi:hypothetical protein